ncbi:DUF6583 family protein [Bacillus andreraoultii]|uniref:DUF6583 family protein n=1 Tax=Bacillus andreraoultii TaxID=1499685 RepID=UPI00053A78A2|nr:DUF6583 family protein [Bacillus andreraoultii]
MKLCESCGSEVREDVQICSSCGSNIRTIQESAASQQFSESNLTNPKPGLSGKTKWILISTIVFLLIGGIVTAAFMFNNNPKKLFFKAEVTTFKNKLEALEKQYGDILDFQKAATEQTSTSAVTVKGNVKFDSGSLNSDMMLLQAIIDQLSIVYASSIIPEEKTNYQTMAFRMGDSTIVDMEMLQTDKQFGMKIPLLHKDFLYLNTNQFGDFMRTFDPTYSGPDTIEVPQYKWSDFELSEKEKNHLVNHYREFFLEALKDDYFSVEKGESYKHNDTKLKLTKVTMALSPTETQNVLKSFIGTMAKDDQLHEIIAKRVAKLAKQSGTEFDPTINGDLTDAKYVKSELKKSLKDAQKEVEKVKIKDGLTYTIFVDKNDQIIDRNIAFGLDGKEFDLNSVLSTKDIPIDNNKRFQETTFSITPTDEKEGKILVTYTNDMNSGKEKRVEDSALSLYVEEYSDVIFDGKLSVNSTYKGKKPNEQKADHHFVLNVGGSAFGDEDVHLSGSVNENWDYNLKEKVGKNNYDISLDFTEFDEAPFSLLLNIESETKIKEKKDVKIPSLADGINVAELSEEEFYDLMLEIQSNVEEFMYNFQSEFFGF